LCGLEDRVPPTSYRRAIQADSTVVKAKAFTEKRRWIAALHGVRGFSPAFGVGLQSPLKVNGWSNVDERTWQAGPSNYADLHCVGWSVGFRPDRSGQFPVFPWDESQGPVPSGLIGLKTLCSPRPARSAGPCSTWQSASFDAPPALPSARPSRIRRLACHHDKPPTISQSFCLLARDPD